MYIQDKGGNTEALDSGLLKIPLSQTIVSQHTIDSKRYCLELFKKVLQNTNITTYWHRKNVKHNCKKSQAL